MKVSQAVVLCGGLGTRLGALTTATPKPLLNIDGQPFLEVLLLEIARHGVRDVLLLAAFEAAQVERYAKTSEIARRFGLRVTVAVEEAPAGTGGALKLAEAQLAPEFLLVNGDTWFDVNLLDLAPKAMAPWLVSMCLREVADASRYGLVELNGEAVTSMSEKPRERRPGLINGGVMVVRRESMQFISANCSLERDVLPALISRGLVAGLPRGGYFIDIGVPETLQRAQSEIPDRLRRPAVFLDRDGVLNVDTGYVGRISQWRWIDGAKAAVKRFNDLGWYVFIVTNQSGIARGFYDEDDLATLHRQIADELAAEGAHVDDIRFSPYHPDASIDRYRLDSDWRKPGAGMILDLLSHWPADAERSLLIGDQPSDLEAARRSGIEGALFEGGRLDTFAAGLLAGRRSMRERVA